MPSQSDSSTQPGSEPRYTNHLIFEGIFCDEDGKQYYLDAPRRLSSRLPGTPSSTLKKFGCITGEASLRHPGDRTIEGHIQRHRWTSPRLRHGLPATEIFDFDITPTAAGPKKYVKGRAIFCCEITRTWTCHCLFTNITADDCGPFHAAYVSLSQSSELRSVRSGGSWSSQRCFQSFT